jgi:ABC-type antimicrobial peptide transport system permease subunit
VVNEAFARTMFPNENPIGKTFGSGTPGKVASASNVVVGLAGDSKYRSLREGLLPIYYSPIEQESDAADQVYLSVRTWAQPDSTVAAVKQVLASLDSQLPFTDIKTMQEQVSASLWQERMLATLATIFAVICVFMTVTGLYGLLSYDVSQRTREFGIRNAVGASKRDIAFLMVRELARIVVPGSILGMALCLWLTKVITAALYGVKPLDPLSVSGALLIVAAIAFTALWAPAWRAMNVDPAAVLRQD